MQLLSLTLLTTLLASAGVTTAMPSEFKTQISCIGVRPSCCLFMSCRSRSASSRDQPLVNRILIVFLSEAQQPRVR
ncbi:hypothetical protein BDW67DRAFT_92916 [Aspergillus spinulosporus]